MTLPVDTDRAAEILPRPWASGLRREESLPRLSIEMGLAAVVATQLWHHQFMGGGLADLPQSSAVPTPAAVEAGV